MAVYTDVTDADLQAFLKPYELGGVLSFKGIAEGVENSNFFLRTERGLYILTLYEKRVDPADLPFFVGLMEHLAARGLSCPVPVHDRSGVALGRLADRSAAIFTFLEGIGTRRPTPHHCHQVGAAMAWMHASAADFDRTRRNRLSIGDWRPLFESCPQVDRLREGLSATIAAELDDLERRWPSGLPAGVIHADMFPDNVFFLEDAFSGLIDFYFACNDLLAYDLAVALCAWCFDRDNRFDPALGRALIAGYESVRPLSGAERDALPVLCRGAALRFLLTRLYDWLTVPDDSFVTKKDPFEYLEKLEFHRTVSSIADYGHQPETEGAA